MSKEKQGVGGLDPSAEKVFSDLVGKVLKDHSLKHPGVITEAVVEAVVKRYDFIPREPRQRERRRNHPERIRRFSHTVFRTIDAIEGPERAKAISEAVLKTFLVIPLRSVPEQD